MDEPSEAEYLEILGHNKGFNEPKTWLPIARALQFTKVDAAILIECPDCKAPPAGVLGQFIYYSTRIELHQCGHCGLVYADKRIDDKIINQHFEQTYKDERYFLIARANIFQEIVSLITSGLPTKAKVLDIGGATGHLAIRLLEARPDLEVVVADVSEEACASVASTLGLQAICGKLSELGGEDKTYDALFLIDILYYEPHLDAAWSTLSTLCKPGGTIILRVPNKLWLIKFSQGARRILSHFSGSNLATKIPFYNPEHLYILTPTYLQQRLGESGFTDLSLLPSCSLQARGVKGKAARIIDFLSFMVWKLSFEKVLISSAILITAKRVAHDPQEGSAESVR